MRTFKVLVLLVLCVTPGKVFAAIPTSINFQSYLTDSGGSPIDNPALNIMFTLHTMPAGGSAFWAETQTVNVTQGLFSVELGAVVSFPVGAFDTPTYLGITVGSDAEMFPRRPLLSVAYAYEANNAMSLQGQSAPSLNQAPHVADTTNPHGVTAAQTGAASVTDFSSHAANTDAHHTRYSNSEAVSAMLAADGSGSGLDADYLDGLSATSFIQPSGDWGRPSVSNELYEGVRPLSNIYVNEGQANSVNSLMILDNSVSASDIGFPLNHNGPSPNGGVVTITNSSAGTPGNLPVGLLGQASGNTGAFYTIGTAGLVPGLGAGSPVLNLPIGNAYGVAGAVTNGIGTAGLSTGGSGVGVYGDGSLMGVKGKGSSERTKGYLGVQGQFDFDGEATLDIADLEIGVLGFSSDTTAVDNYGIYGVSNGTGIYAEGTVLAGKFVGNIATDKVSYNAPRTHYYSVGDGDFYSALGESFSTSTGNGGTYMTVTGFHVMVAGLHLPDGAKITQFRASVDDNAAYELSFSLQRLAHGGDGLVPLASVSSAFTPGLATYTDTTIASPIVNNELYSYHVRVFSTNWPGNSSLKIKGAVVAYTINEAD